jgi:hypothetical protein
MYRLTMSSVHHGYFDVSGKGRDGGKKRTISWDEEMQTILEEYFLLRTRWSIGQNGSILGQESRKGY